MYAPGMNIEIGRPALIADGCADSNALLERIAEAAGGMEIVTVDKQEILRRLKNREAIASTALGRGVAIPHCMVEGMQSIAVGLVVARPPVVFNAPGGEKVDLFFYIISPEDARTLHLQVLAAISRAVRQDTFREDLRRASSGEELSSLVEAAISLPAQEMNEKPCRFRILIQDPDLVQDVIEDLSAFGAGSMVVYEGENASSYLGNLPLFAGLWSSREDTGIRVIEGIVHQVRANELVRRVADQTDHRPGVLVTVQDLLVAHGSLEL